MLHNPISFHKSLKRQLTKVCVQVKKWCGNMMFPMIFAFSRSPFAFHMCFLFYWNFESCIDFRYILTLYPYPEVFNFSFFTDILFVFFRIQLNINWRVSFRKTFIPCNICYGEKFYILVKNICVVRATLLRVSRYLVLPAFIACNWFYYQSLLYNKKMNFRKICFIHLFIIFHVWLIYLYPIRHLLTYRKKFWWALNLADYPKKLPI